LKKLFLLIKKSKRIKIEFPEKKSGQVLVEVMFVIGVVTVALTALVSAVVVSLQNTNYAKEAALKNQKAQEIMECLRHQRDTQGLTNLSSGDCIEGEDGAEVSISGEDDSKNVTVTIEWGPNQIHKVEINSILTRWDRSE